MKNPIINSLFPIPIYSTDINRNFTKKELGFVKDQKNYCTKNEGNIHTTDSYILNKPELKKINYTEENQYHHMHEHPNSVVSGVLYFDCDKDNDKIKFFNPLKYKQISPKIDETKFNLWNSSSWWFALKTGELLMFPSSTTHKVEVKKGSNTRISLSFNTFYKGTMGSNRDLTELIL